MISDTDIDLLESWLDGELTTPEQEGVQRRLREEPELSAQLAELRELRMLREGFFTALEPSADPAPALLEGIARREADHASLAGRFRLYRYVSAAAALLAVGFLGGWLAHLAPRAPVGGGHTMSVNQTTNLPTYEVAITDETGHVIAVQRFNDPEQARQFSEDLERSQQQIHQLQSGHVTVRSAQF